MRQKIQLYILSLWLLFVLLFVSKVRIPHCFASDCTFIGIRELMLLNIIPLISLFFILIGLIFYKRFHYIVVKGSRDLPEQILKIENINWEHLTFLVTYIIPLLSFSLSFDFHQDRNGLMFFLVLLMIGLIYVKTNMFYNNPTLAILGYHIYKVKIKNAPNIIFISRDNLTQGDWIRKRHISDNIYFSIKSNKNDDQ